MSKREAIQRARAALRKGTDAGKAAASRGAELGQSAIEKGASVGGAAVGKVADWGTAAGAAFLGLPELLKWSESVTKSTASVYDKALDAEYLRTHIGGGNHRMFDGGHDLASAWNAARDAVADDAFLQEVVGYASAVWKDVTTVKGLPFVTWSKDSYDACAEWVASCVPGASKGWFYDAMSFDVFEVLGAAMGVVGAVFFLRRDDVARLSELVGALGVTSIAAANPLTGIAVVAVAGWAMAVKRHRLDAGKLATGAGMAGISVGLFALMGLPVLIELVIVVVLGVVVRRQVFERKELVAWVRSKMGRVRERDVAGQVASVG